MKILLFLEATYARCELFLNVLGEIIKILEILVSFLDSFITVSCYFTLEMCNFYCDSWDDTEFLLIVAITPLFYPQNIHIHIHSMLYWKKGAYPSWLCRTNINTQ